MFSAELKTLVPPASINKSENLPTNGFAVIPLKPSLPLHFKPIISLSTEISVLSNVDAYSFNSSISFTPSAISSSTSCVIRNLTLYSSNSPKNSLKESTCLFSHPRPKTSTPPVFGCFTIPLKIFLVVS